MLSLILSAGEDEKIGFVPLRITRLAVVFLISGLEGKTYVLYFSTESESKSL